MGDFNLNSLLFGEGNENDLGDEINGSIDYINDMGLAIDLNDFTNEDSSMAESTMTDDTIDTDSEDEESNKMEDIDSTNEETKQEQEETKNQEKQQTTNTEKITNTTEQISEEDKLFIDKINTKNPIIIKSAINEKGKKERNIEKIPNPIEQLNLKELYSRTTHLTPNLRKYCSSLKGTDGPIFKYTELFPSPSATIPRRKYTERRISNFIPLEEAQVYIEPDNSELFEEITIIPVETTTTERCASPPIISINDLIDDDDDDDDDEKLEEIIVEEKEEEETEEIKTKNKEKKYVYYPTSGGYDPYYQSNSSPDCTNNIDPHVFEGIEQELWENKIIWSDDSDMDMDKENDKDNNNNNKEEEEKEEEENIDLELLKKMNLWPPKQSGLDITNKFDIQLPKKRRFEETMDYSSEEDEEEEIILENKIIGNNIGIRNTVDRLSLGISTNSYNINLKDSISSNTSNPLLKSTTSQNLLIQPPIKKQKINSYSEVTKYKYPYKNYDLEEGNWEKNIIWDTTNDFYKKRKKKPKIIFDFNDKHMLYEEEFIKLICPNAEIKKEEINKEDKEKTEEEEENEENNNKKKKITKKKEKKERERLEKLKRESEFKLALQKEEEELRGELDPFNISQDSYYVKRKSLRRKKISKPKIYHSPVALKHSLVRPYLSKEQLEYFHKPRTESIPNNFPLRITVQKRNLKRNTRSNKSDYVFKKKADLSSSEGDLIALEYIEKEPLSVMNIGMASKLVNYTRKKKSAEDEEDDDEENEDNELEIGETIRLEPTDQSPFVGDVLPGQTIRSISNNLFRVPISPHETSQTDFLLVKSADNSKLTIRPLPNLYTCGQLQPMLAVPAPNSRNANIFRKNRLQSFIYRFFKRKTKKHAKRLRIADISSAFPCHSDANVRKYLKQTAEFQRGGDDSGWWTLRPNLTLPTEEQLQSMIDPESICLFESMLVGSNKLRNYGIKSLMNPNGIQNILEGSEIHDYSMKNGIKRVEEELLLTPWNLSSNFVNAAKEKCMLQLTGFGTPTKGDITFSYIKLPLKVQQKKKKKPKLLRPVTGTGADLRKLSQQDADKWLSEHGISDEVIATLQRWDKTKLIRKISSQAADKATNDETLKKFARGTKHSLVQQKKQYAAKAQEIFENQLDFIATDNYSSDSDSFEESDEEDMDFAREVFERMKNTSNIDNDESSIISEDNNNNNNINNNNNNNTNTSNDNNNNQMDVDKNEKSVPKVNITPRLKNPLPGTKWIKKTTTIRNNDGTITKRIEIVRDHDKVEELEKRMKQSKPPNMKVQLSAEDEQIKVQKRRERRRLQERLRRLKKTKEKQKVLQDLLIQGSTDGILPNSSVPLTCGACGMSGHMKTNRTCPVFQETSKKKTISKVEGTKIRISSKAINLAAEEENNNDNKLVISIPKSIVNDSYDLNSNKRKTQRGMRTKTQLQIGLNNILEKVIGKVRDDPKTLIFRDPVNEKIEAPGYYDIIKTPMYFNLIYSKCRDGKYSSVSDLMEDVDLIVSNCYQYNKGRNDHILPLADVLKDLVYEKLDEHKQEIEEIELIMEEKEGN